MQNFAEGENSARKSEIEDINARMAKENEERNSEDKALHERIDKEIRDREAAVADLQSKLDDQADKQGADLDELRTRMMKENAFLRNMAGRTNSVFFDAYRTKAYDGGGEENLTFQVCKSKNGYRLQIDLQ